ncbi:MAG: Hsp70 family protein, partial [Alphaproteobacteria bacterium]|nr:Hsp70 family protein [Alphaproteobacteria bacterium]
MYVCGIDFGTTNSALGVCSEKTSPVMIPLEDENTRIPSALFFHEDGRFFMGKKAVEMYVSREEGRFMRSLKRILGTELMNFYTSVCGRGISFEEIISRFLYNLKEKAEKTVGERIFQVIMGRP